MEEKNQTVQGEESAGMLTEHTPAEQKTEHTAEQHTDSTEEQTPEGAGYRVFSAVRKIFVYLLSLFIIVAAFFFAADRSPTKSMFGYRYYIVLTDSMVPEFASGDMVFVSLREKDSIAVGDIITFNPSSGSDAYLTHRVTERLDNYQGTGVTCYRTKGDANDAEDSFLIDEDRVIGRVKCHVPRLGTIVRFVQLRWYFLVPIAVLLIIFFRLMRYYFTVKKENTTQTDPKAKTEAQ